MLKGGFRHACKEALQLCLQLHKIVDNIPKIDCQNMPNEIHFQNCSLKLPSQLLKHTQKYYSPCETTSSSLSAFKKQHNVGGLNPFDIKFVKEFQISDGPLEVDNSITSKA